MTLLNSLSKFFKQIDKDYDENLALEIENWTFNNPQGTKQKFEIFLRKIGKTFFKSHNVDMGICSDKLFEIIKEERSTDMSSFNDGPFFQMKDIVEEFIPYFEQRCPSISSEQDFGNKFELYLKGKLGEKVFNIRELGSGNGYLDLLVIFSDFDKMKEPKILFEFKIWYGKSYFEEGLERLKRYMDTERLDKSFYLVVDTRKSTKSKSDSYSDSGRKVYVYFIKGRK